MAVFTYTAVDQDGAQRQGTIDAVNLDVAISALQRRGLIVSSVDPVKEKLPLLKSIPFLNRVKGSDIVMISRQMTTLFEAQVSALRAFRLLAAEARTPALADRLSTIANDIQSGSSISSALSRHPDVFSPFYVSMVRAGEESGKLDETFQFLADYMDRNYEITSRARNALIYPAFIFFAFFVVMYLMLTLVIPKLSVMLAESGQELPLYTRAVIALSDFLRSYSLLLGALLLFVAMYVVHLARTESGQALISRARMQLPVMGSLYQKLFLSRLADNLSTMLRSGVQVLRGLEITASVVGDPVYEKIVKEAAEDVKGGLPLSEAFRKHPDIPGIVVAMIKIGEETGNMGQILETMAKFYRREVNNALDTLVSLIEPFMIVGLAVGVAILLASILMPIYNIAASF